MQRKNHKSHDYNRKSCFSTKSPSERASCNRGTKKKSCTKKSLKNNKRQLRQQLYYNDLIQKANFLQGNDKVHVIIHFNQNFSLKLGLPSCMTIFQLNQLISSYTKLHKKHAPTVNHIFSGLYIKNEFLNIGPSKNQVWQKNGLKEQTCEHIVKYLKKSLILSSPQRMLSDIAKTISKSEGNSVDKDQQFYGKKYVSPPQLKLVVQYDSLSQEFRQISSQNDKGFMSIIQLEDYQLQDQNILQSSPQSKEIGSVFEHSKEENILLDENKPYHRIQKGRNALRKLSINDQNIYQNVDKCKTNMQNNIIKPEKIQHQPIFLQMSIIQEANDESSNRTLQYKSPKRASPSKSNIYVKQRTQMNQSPQNKIEKKQRLRKTKTKSEVCNAQISQGQNLITFEEDYQTLKNSRKQNGHQISADKAENQNTALKWINHAQVIQWLVLKDIIADDKAYTNFTTGSNFQQVDYQNESEQNQDAFYKFPIRLRGHQEIYDLVLINLSSKGTSTKQDIQLLVDLIRRLFINRHAQMSHRIQDIFTYTSQNHPTISPCLQMPCLQMPCLQMPTVSVVLNHASLENVPLVSYLTNLLADKLNEESAIKKNTNGLVDELKFIIQTVAQRIMQLVYSLEQLVQSLKQSQFQQNNKENKNKKAFEAAILFQLLQITEEGQTLNDLKHPSNIYQRFCDTQNTYFLNLFSLISDSPNVGSQSQTRFGQQSVYFLSAYRRKKFKIGLNTLGMMQKLAFIIRRRISQRDHFINIRKIKHKKQAERQHIQKLFKKKEYFNSASAGLQASYRIRQQQAQDTIHSKKTQITQQKPLSSLIHRLISQVLSLCNNFPRENKGLIHLNVLSQIEQGLKKFGISSNLNLNAQSNIVCSKSKFIQNQFETQSQQNQQVKKKSGVLETYLCKSTKRYVKRWFKTGSNEQTHSQYTRNTVFNDFMKKLNKKKSQLTKTQYFLKCASEKGQIKITHNYHRPQIYWFKPNDHILMHQKQTTLKKKSKPSEQWHQQSQQQQQEISDFNSDKQQIFAKNANELPKKMIKKPQAQNLLTKKLYNKKKQQISKK